MTTFVANTASDMDVFVADLAILSDPATTWTATGTTFTATGANGAVIHGTGAIQGVVNGMPGAGSTITGLSFEHGAASGTFTGLLLDFSGTVSFIPVFGVAAAFATLLVNGPDTLTGSQGNDVLDGGGSSDTISGLAGNDTLFGGWGNDVLHGGAGNDTIHGGDHGDLIHGDAGNDNLFGDGASDTFFGSAGRDVIDGGDGYDLVDYSSETRAVNVHLNGSQMVDVNIGGHNDDRIMSVQGIITGKGADVVVGDGNDNFLVGNAGNDHLTGNDGDDHLDGGNGADVLNGGGADDFLPGGNGNDGLRGGAGLDELRGGRGSDTLTGGSEADTFVFDTALNALTNVDRITDFKVGVDKIDLYLSVFSAITLADFANQDFFAVGHARDGNDRIVYQPGSGHLVYDANGSAAGGQTLFTVLAPHLHLQVTDFI